MLGCFCTYDQLIIKLYYGRQSKPSEATVHKMYTFGTSHFSIFKILFIVDWMMSFNQLWEKIIFGKQNHFKISVRTWKSKCFLHSVKVSIFSKFFHDIKSRRWFGLMKLQEIIFMHLILTWHASLLVNNQHKLHPALVYSPTTIS